MVLMMLFSIFSVVHLSAFAQENEIAEEGADINVAEDGVDIKIADEGAVVKHFDITDTYQTNNLYIALNVGDSVTISFKERSSSGNLKIESYIEYSGWDKNIISVYSESDESIWFYPGGVGPKTYTITALRSGKTDYTLQVPFYNHDKDIEGRYYVSAHITVTGGSSSGSGNLSTPQITDFDSVDSGVKITWGAVSGAAKYRVYYKGSKGWTKMGDTASTSFIDTDVKSGSTYTYTVRCINSAGTAFTSGYSSAGWKYTYNMATPKITSMTSSSSGVKITWGAVANAKKYRVYYKGSKGWTKMADVTGTSYTDSDVSWGSTYTYTVRCLKSDASRFTSSYDSTGWKHTHYLSTPSISGFESTASGVKITWGAVSGAAKYRVYYKGSKGWTKMGETTGTSFTDTDVRAGSTYRYTVRCLDAAASKFTSSYNSTGWTYTYNPYVATPYIKSCEVVSNGIKISWGAVSGASLYRVYYKSSNGWTRIADTKSTSYVHTNANYGITYTYTVRCLSADGKSFISSFDSSGMKCSYITTPKLTSFSRDKKNYLTYVTISDLYTADFYKIWVKSSKTNSGWQYIGTINSKSGKLVDDNSWGLLLQNNTYVFGVQGFNSSGKSISGFDENGFSLKVEDYI